MKQLLLFVLLLLFGQLSFSQIELNDETAFYDYKYDKALIKNRKVESLTVSKFNNGKVFSKAKYFFDTLGLLIKEIGIDGSGKTTTEFYFEANSYGDLIYKKEISYTLKKEYETQFFKQYSNGKLIRDSSYGWPVYEYAYNDKGDLIQTVLHSPLVPGAKNVISNRYDSTGRVKEIMERQFNSNNDTTGVLISHRLLFYNGNNKLTREEELIHLRYNLVPGNGSKRYTYDENDNLVEIIRSGASSRRFTYNKKGLITSCMALITFGDKELFDMSKFKTELQDSYTYTFRQ